MTDHMVLYHYTCTHHLPTIVDVAYLKLTESNIHPTEEHAGPDVVWFTTDHRLMFGHGLDNGAPEDHLANKKRIRITVEVPVEDVWLWEDWADEQGISPIWKKALSKVGGMDTWWVTLRPVPVEEWVEIRDMKTDQVIWDSSM